MKKGIASGSASALFHCKRRAALAGSGTIHVPMSLQLRPLHPLFAAEASGVDLRRPLDDATVRAIEEAMDRHAVLAWRGQPFSEDQQVAFARRFGPLDLGLRKARMGKHRFRYDELIDISNLTPQGEVAGRGHAKIVSICDLRAAYDALADRQKDELENLRSQHYAFHTRLWLGDTSYTEEQLKSLPPVEWPLVRTHPGSGRRVLWVGAHATHIVGWTLAEGRMLLAELLEHATQRELVYRHRWRAGDLVMWDNRCTLHRGRRFDLSQRRELRRTTTEDVA